MNIRKEAKKVAVTVNTRMIVLDIIMRVNDAGEFSHVLLNDALSKYQYLDKNQRAFISRLTLGSIEKKIELDYVIDMYSKTATAKMKPLIRNLLELSTYQIMYMDNVPDSAVCNEAVKIAQKRGFVNLKGFINGVLRNIARHAGNIIYPDRTKDIVRYLSVKYSIPEWIIRMWSESYDYDMIEDMLIGISCGKKTYIRCNTHHITVDELCNRLRTEGVTCRRIDGLPVGWQSTDRVPTDVQSTDRMSADVQSTHMLQEVRLPYALEISNYDYLAGLTSFNDGLFQVQDISSMLEGEVASPKAGNLVIDVCAAPGGKSINVALKMLESTKDTGKNTDCGMDIDNNADCNADTCKQIKVIARDLTDTKAELIEQNVYRLGLEDYIDIEVHDACILDDSLVGKADIVIADLPCSGLGIMGRKPDIKNRLTHKDCEDLAALQRDILSVVKDYVKPGGILVYSTCTISKLENEDNAWWFANSFDFERSDNYGQILPDRSGRIDGFFIAKFTRKLS